MRRGAALARSLVLVLIALSAGAASAAAAKGEIRCASNGAYAQLKTLADTASPDDFAKALAQSLLAEECYVAFVEAPPPVRMSKTEKPPPTPARGTAKAPEAAGNRAGLARAIDKVWDTMTAPCKTADCTDYFSAAGYAAE